MPFHIERLPLTLKPNPPAMATVSGPLQNEMTRVSVEIVFGVDVACVGGVSMGAKLAPTRVRARDMTSCQRGQARSFALSMADVRDGMRTSDVAHWSGYYDVGGAT